MRRPRIAILGATGRQGGAVARAVLARGDWQVRAVTRHVDGVAARTLAALGAEVCRADLDTVESLRPALRDAQALFGVTNFWEHGDPMRELRQAGNLAEAAAAWAPAQVIWSTLEDSRAVLTPPDGQRYAVPHLDAKAEANALFLELDLPVTLLLTSFFWENFIDYGMGPTRAADGHLELSLPLGEARLPGIAVEDIGHVVAGLLDSPNTQRRIGIAGEHPTGVQMAAYFSEALGEPVRWRDIPLPVYAQFPFPGAPELAAMFDFKQRANAAYCASRSTEATRALHPRLMDLRAWLAKHASALRALEAQVSGRAGTSPPEQGVRAIDGAA